MMAGGMLEATPTRALRVGADTEQIRLLGAAVRAFVDDQAPGDASGLADRLELAVQEIAVNQVRHALGGAPGRRIACRLLHLGDEVVVTLRDDGVPFAPSDVRRPDLDVPGEGGYGLFLVDSLVTSLAYRRSRAGNRWTLRAAIPAPAAGA